MVRSQVVLHSMPDDHGGPSYLQRIREGRLAPTGVHMRKGGSKMIVCRRVLSGLLALAVVLGMELGAEVESAQKGAYRQVNLVSDVSGLARRTDSNLVNPWGIAMVPNGPWWIADNGTGVSTLYLANGTRIPLVVTIPPPAGSADSAAPTGIVANATSDFVVTGGGRAGASLFLFVTEDGTLSGWNPQVNLTNAILAVDRSTAEAVYKGLALGSNASGNFLYAANFHEGTIDVFDRNFHPASLAGSFADPTLPTGFAPFNIQNLRGKLYVAYAKQDADKHDEVPGPGNGYVNVFDTDGRLLHRAASQGTLNAPWGLAFAPDKFGKFSKALLVGNFGDGRINAFDPDTDAFLGQLEDSTGKPITIEGLWALAFTDSHPRALYFTAGIDDEMHGLFGKLVPASLGD